MNLVFLICFVLQNGSTAAPTQEQLDMQHKIQELERQNQEQSKNIQTLLDQNEIFKGQIDSLVEFEVSLFADLQDSMAVQINMQKQQKQNDEKFSQFEAQIAQIDAKLSKNTKIVEKNEMKSLRNEWAIKYGQKPVIAFRASCASNFPEDSKKSSDVIWKNMEYNIGNAFNPSTGTFTCPHEGIYSFYATSPIRGVSYRDATQATGTSHGRISIVVNGRTMAQHYSQNNQGYDYIWNRYFGEMPFYQEYTHSSPKAVIKLKKGDNVKIFMNGRFYRPNSYCQSTYFEGHLIDLAIDPETKSIWISIDATDSSRNSKGGEFKFHSIMNNAPAYRNTNNEYLAYDGDTWLITSENCFLKGVTCGWFKINSTEKNPILLAGPHQWQEGDGVGWSNNAIIKISAMESI